MLQMHTSNPQLDHQQQRSVLLLSYSSGSAATGTQSCSIISSLCELQQQQQQQQQQQTLGHDIEVAMLVSCQLMHLSCKQHHAQL